MHLIERLLCKVFKYRDIVDEGTGEIYLRRWFVYPLNPEKVMGERCLYVHKFYRGDRDRFPHDHPNSFTSLILAGGYWEHSLNPVYERWIAELLLQGKKHIPMGVGFPQRLTRTWYGPGSILKRGAKWVHRVELPKGKFAWTLFLTGPREREWGFHTDNGWCHNHNYHDGICWCETEEDKKLNEKVQ